MRLLVIFALVTVTLAVPFKSENEEPKSDIVTQNLVPNLEDDKSLVNAVNLLEETEKELEDSELAKKSPTTVCVEVQPKNPYEKPYTVCEPVNHSHGPVVQPASTYGTGSGAAAGYKAPGGGYQPQPHGQAASAGYKAPAAGTYQQGGGYAGGASQQAHGAPYGGVAGSQSQYGPGSAMQYGSAVPPAASGQYGTPAISPQYGPAASQYGGSSPQYGAGSNQYYGSNAQYGAMGQYGAAPASQYGPASHVQVAHYGQAPAHFSAPSSYSHGYSEYAPGSTHGGSVHFGSKGYRQTEDEHNMEDPHNMDEESLGSSHKLLHKKKGGSFGGSHSHNSPYRTVDPGYGPSAAVPSFVVAQQEVAGYKPNQHYTQASTYVPALQSYSSPVGGYPAPAYSPVSYQTPALPSYSVMTPSVSTYGTTYPAASAAYSVPSISTPAYTAPVASPYAAIQTLPPLPSYAVANAAPAVYQAAAVQSQSYSAPVQTYAASAPVQSQAYSVPAAVSASPAAYSPMPSTYAQPQTYTTYTAQPQCPTNYLFSCAPSIRPVPCSQPYQPQTVQVTPYSQPPAQVKPAPAYQPTYGPGKVGIYRDAEEGQTNQSETDQTQERSNNNSEGLPVQPKATMTNLEQIKQDQMAMETIARMNELAAQNQKGQKKLTEEQNKNISNGKNNSEDKKVGSEATSADGQGISKSSS